MGQVTYLIGAGASANCVSIGAKIPEGFKAMRESFIEYGSRSSIADWQTSNEIAEEVERILENIDPSRERKIEFGSIDEYAKYLFEGIDTRTTKWTDYLKVKVLLSLLIRYEEHSKAVDSRHIRFFSHAYNKGVLNDKVRIISWNYDSQFEESFRQLQKIDIQESRRRLGVVSKNLFPILGSGEAGWMPNPQETFSILKINGTADFYHTKMRSIFSNLPDFHHDLCDKYRGTMHGKDPDTLLSYAWEDEDRAPGYNGIVDLAIKIAEETSTLIIIGYTIQPFNHHIDGRIFQAMTNIDKVIIQDLDPKSVERRFLSLLPEPMRNNGGKPIPIEVIPVKDGFPLAFLG